VSGLFDNEPAPLFPQNPGTQEIKPLFQEDSPQSPEKLFVSPPLPPDDLTTPPNPNKPATSTPEPLLPPDPLDNPPTVSQGQGVSPTILPQEPLVNPPIPGLSKEVANPALPPDPLHSPPPSAGFSQPAPVFGEPEDDPLVSQALRHLSEKYPDDYAAHKGYYRSQLATLLPLTFDRINGFAEGPLKHVQVALQEVTTSTQAFSALSVSSILQEITEAAQRETQRPSHGISGLLKRVEKVVNPFDPNTAYGTLARLTGDVQIIHQRLSGIADLTQETLTSIRFAVQILSVILVMAEKTEFANQVQRRYDLFLTTGQELQMAIQQIQQLQAQTEQVLMQITEVKTVTLPSLGFLGAISQP